MTNKLPAQMTQEELLAAFYSSEEENKRLAIENERLRRELNKWMQKEEERMKANRKTLGVKDE